MNTSSHTESTSSHPPKDASAPSATFAERYKDALHAYLDKGDEPSLLDAYGLGREALDQRAGLLKIVETHGHALRDLIDDGTVDQLAAIPVANRFLLEALSSFEITRTSHRDSITALRMMNRRRDEETKRIALSLHDEAGQLLASAYLELSLVEQECWGRSVLKRVHRVRSHLDQVGRQLRHISHELSPPALQQLGLVTAINYLADGIQSRSGLSIMVKDDAQARTRFSSAIETALYRIVLEALNNTVKHAQASHAEISLCADERFVTCVIKDDGIGFDPESTRAMTHGLGVLGMRERAQALHGTLRVESSPDKGTVLRISIPRTEA